MAHPHQEFPGVTRGKPYKHVITLPGPGYTPRAWVVGHLEGILTGPKYHFTPSQLISKIIHKHKQMANLSNSNLKIPQLDSPGQIDLIWLEVNQLNHKIKGKT